MGYIQLSLVISLRLSVCYKNMGRKNLEAKIYPDGINR